MATVTPYDATLHEGMASADHCGQGVTECDTAPEFSVRGERQTISACGRHLAGAVREAHAIPH